MHWCCMLNVTFAAANHTARYAVKYLYSKCKQKGDAVASNIQLELLL